MRVYMSMRSSNHRMCTVKAHEREQNGTTITNSSNATNTHARTYTNTRARTRTRSHTASSLLDVREHIMNKASQYFRKVNKNWRKKAE